MQDLKEYIKEKRSTLSDSSIITYNSILKNLYKKVFETKDIEPKKFETHSDKIIEFMKDLPPNKRKTILSALVVITNDKTYRDLMLTDISDYNKTIKTQEKSETQKENWTDGNAIKSLLEELKNACMLIYKKPQLTMNDYQNIQSYIILCLLGGSYIPPRRSKDYCNFKIKNIDKAKDNYLDKNQLIFNSYKTAKCYGEQKVEIPKELKAILTKWIKINPTEYLLFDNNQNQLTNVKLNQRLNKLFDGKKISINALRHCYLTDKYGETIKQNQAIANDMSAMGSSVNMLTTYVKKD